MVAAGTFALACFVFALIVVTLNESHAAPILANEEEKHEEQAEQEVQEEQEEQAA